MHRQDLKRGKIHSKNTQGRIIAESRIIKGHANRGEWKKIHVRAG